MAVQANWFDTLSQALEAEGLSDVWPWHLSVKYGESVGFAARGQWITIYRHDQTGRYERPIHYATQMADTYPIEPTVAAGRALTL